MRTTAACRPVRTESAHLLEDREWPIGAGHPRRTSPPARNGPTGSQGRPATAFWYAAVGHLAVASDLVDSSRLAPRPAAVVVDQQGLVALPHGFIEQPDAGVRARPG